MSMAARRVNEAAVLKRYLALQFDSSPYSFSIKSTASGSTYSVTDGKQTQAQPLAWVFGSGEFGQTFLYRQNQDWFESEVSFYKRLGGLDITTGHEADPHASLADALGKRLRPADAQSCFQCHTTYATHDGRLDAEHAVAGLGCEACHGPGKAHVSQMRAPADAKGQPSANALTHASAPTLQLMDLSALSPVDSVDFCGACHRTWADIAFSPARNLGVAVVRFQPYRLELSKCWGKNGDERITCVACHDPHEPLEHNASAYDGRCLSCHAAGTPPIEHVSAKICPVSPARCTSCHMPKYNVASMHGDFTDHWIRVVTPGEGFRQ